MSPTLSLYLDLTRFAAALVVVLGHSWLVLYPSYPLHWPGPPAVIVFFVLDRTVGLPNATADIGNWVEPLGLASLVVEGFVVAIGLGGFLAARDRA